MKNLNKVGKKAKAAVAMSGGVDSSVAAALLKQQGYDVVGVFMRFWPEKPKGEFKFNELVNCRRSFEAEKMARGVCEKIGIPFYTLNVAREFKKAVVDYFLNEYKRGTTPNPCVVCNKEIKFKLLAEKAKSLGADMVATGHYARIRRETKNQKPKTKNYEYHLIKAKDKNKDQSYFLYNLTQLQLAEFLFPIGDYTKSEVRKMAKKFNLPSWDRPESQEICFILDNDIQKFLSERLRLKSGEIIDADGKILGIHQGLALFTIGQRHGLGIGGGKPYYVAGFNLKKNQLIITSNPKDELLFRDILTACNVNWISGKNPRLPLSCSATIRYRHKPEKAVVSRQGKNFKAVFAKPQRAITPGQSVVFYKDAEALGGGLIS